MMELATCSCLAGDYRTTTIMPRIVFMFIRLVSLQWPHDAFYFALLDPVMSQELSIHVLYWLILLLLLLFRTSEAKEMKSMLTGIAHKIYRVSELATLEGLSTSLVISHEHNADFIDFATGY